MTERVLGLRNANRKMSKSLGRVGIDLLLRKFAEFNLLRAVHDLADALDALLDGTFQLIQQLEVFRFGASCQNTQRQLHPQPSG